MVTKGLPFLWLMLCIALARSPLPVPVSPIIKTVASVEDTVSARRQTSSMRGSLVNTSSRDRLPPERRSSSSFSGAGAPGQLVSAWRISPSVNGLRR